MSELGSQRNHLDPYEVVAARCAELGLAVWRCNPAGIIISEPDEEGLLGLWHNASTLSQKIARAVCELSGQTPTEPIKLDTSCWAIVVPVMWRNRLGGYIVALALGEDLFESQLFADACESAQLDVAATRRCLRGRAGLNSKSVQQAMRLVRWMVDDLESVGELDETISGFTLQLGNAYETIDLLYALGHSMNEPNEPGQFITAALDRLYIAMDFAWVAAVFHDDADAAPVVHGRFYARGEPTMPQSKLRKACRDLVESIPTPKERHILSDRPGFDPDGGPQIILQPILRSRRLAGFLLAGEKGGVDPQVSSYDTHLLEATGSYIGPFLENASLYETQNRMFLGTLHALTSAIDAKDPYTHGHSERVAYLAAQLASAIGFEHDQVERVHIAGLVHDIGKIGVPEHILSKPGRLDDAEMNAIREHPAIGHRILQDIPLLDDILPGVLYHHERWDGTGYPSGLAGDKIPLIARIIGVADTFDAMSSNRAYRPALTRDRVLAEIRNCAGTQFDPDLVEPFLGIDLAEYDRMVEQAHAESAKSAISRAA